MGLLCILYWDLNQFAILKRVGDDRAVILDPAVDERALPLAAVSKHFTGVALEFMPTAKFKLGDVRLRIRFRELTGRVCGLPVALTQIFVLAIALEALALVALLFKVA